MISRKRTKATMLIGGAVVASAGSLLPAGGQASRSALPAGAIAMPSLPTLQAARAALHSETADCALPLVISITCVGVGTPMSYGGGAIQTSPKVYIVFWGWNGRDPSGQGPYQEQFFSGVGGSTWSASQTQYCDSTTAFGLLCAGGNTVGNPNPVFVTSTNAWSDNTNAVPNSPDDSAIQAEAVRAASHFGNTTAASNASTQYIIDTPQGNSTSGFGSWCAYHGMASSSFGGLSYTDFPYQTDAGAGCGENFINQDAAGVLDGVSIVGGHEFAESATDPNPPLGWTDTIGAETGDKCAWIQAGPGAVTDVTLSSGTFAVQGLWSNNDLNGAGGCVTFYASPSNQN